MTDDIAAALAPWLEAELGIAGALSLRPLGGGQSNPTYLLEVGGRRMVLRRKPFGDLLPSAHAVDREYRVMKALGAEGLPVPRMLGHCSDPGVIGAEFFVMEMVEGRVLHDTRMPGLEPAERRAICLNLIDLLARLHAVDPDAAGLGDFGKQGGYIPRQVKRWSGQYRASATDPIPEMDRLIDWLPDAVAGLPDETCVVHGDYRLDNCILGADGSIRALLDWELSTLGHPLADLGYFLMVWHFPGDLRWGLADSDLGALGIPADTELAERYAGATGRDLPPMDLLFAYNIFRMAAIIQGVYHRGLSGNAASAEAVRMGEDARRLAALAWHFARRAGA